MNSEIRKMLEGVRQGTVSVDDALLALKKEPFTDIGYAKVDLHRGIRQGAAEVIYGAGKTPAQMIGIIGVMRRRGQRTILITRLSPEAAQEIAAAYPLDYHEDARCGIIVNVTPFEPEWEGYVTLEFSNTTPLPAKIYANEGCAQVLFFEGDEECETSYRDRGGKYQGQVGVTLPRT